MMSTTTSGRRAQAKAAFDEQIARMKQREEAAGQWCTCGHSLPTHDVGFTCQFRDCSCLNFKPSNAPAPAQTEVTTRGNQQRDLIEHDEGWTPKPDAPTPTQGEHTPLPWKTANRFAASKPSNWKQEAKFYQYITTEQSDPVFPARTEAEARMNAAFIVKAVNNHEKLISFVEYVRKFYQDNFDVMPVAFQTVDSEAEQLLEDLNG